MSSLLCGAHLKVILPLTSPWPTLAPRDASSCLVPSVNSATLCENRGPWIFVDLWRSPQQLCIVGLLKIKQS